MSPKDALFFFILKLSSNKLLPFIHIIFASFHIFRYFTSVIYIYSITPTEALALHSEGEDSE